MKAVMEKYSKTFNKAFQPEYRVTMTTKLKKNSLLHIKLLKKCPRWKHGILKFITIEWEYRKNSPRH